MGNIEKFESIANIYDTRDRTRIAGIIADTVRTYIIDGGEKTAIDYGCGTGLVGLRLLNDFRSVLFVDAAHNMIEQVRQKIADMKADNAAVLCCDLEKERKDGLRADYVILAQTLLHIKEVKPILSSLFEVLNQGGHLLVVDFNKNEAIVSSEVHNGFDRNSLADILLDIGFTEAESIIFHSENGIFMGQDASLFILDAMKS